MKTEILTYAVSLSQNHPVKVYLEENEYFKNKLIELSECDFKTDYQKAYNVFNEVSRIEIRYTRKENQLFPYLEKRGWFGPSQGISRRNEAISNCNGFIA